MDKQIILFIVEGESDKHSFENILNKIISNDVVKFKVVKGDITVKSNKYTVCRQINKKVDEFLNEPKNKVLKVSDICKVVHLVDLDAVFINDDKIIKNDKDSKEYKDDCYLVPNRNNIIERNRNKKEVILKLKDLSFIKYKQGDDINIIPYEIYYFSCNLEHVLHDNPNVETKEQKKELSELFAEEYLGKEKNFIKFIKSEKYATTLEYQQSWNECIKEQNALKRATNFNLFFK